MGCICAKIFDSEQAWAKRPLIKELAQTCYILNSEYVAKEGPIHLALQRRVDEVGPDFGKPGTKFAEIYEAGPEFGHLGTFWGLLKFKNEAEGCPTLRTSAFSIFDANEKPLCNIDFSTESSHDGKWPRFKFYDSINPIDKPFCTIGQYKTSKAFKTEWRMDGLEETNMQLDCKSGSITYTLLTFWLGDRNTGTPVANVLFEGAAMNLEVASGIDALLIVAFAAAFWVYKLPPTRRLPTNSM